ncbi:hypothetical protein LBMAG56_13030 [Verrucomicrobiota bacterium]|nr:hypothetical protein LBMAG56_13030 [Verrucomicrobiota bacterium]
MRRRIGKRGNGAAWGQITRNTAGWTLAASGALPMNAGEWGSGVLGKGMEAKEWGRGDFLSSFLCLHSFAQSGSEIAAQIPGGHGAFGGPLEPLTCREPERRNGAAWGHRAW